MKFTTTIISLGLLFSGSVLADSKVWGNGGVESNLSPKIKVDLFNNVSGDINIGLTFPSDDCLAFEEQVHNAPSYNINGTLVKTYAQCVGKGERMDFPATLAGKEYVINQFKFKKLVVYGQDGFEITFSAIGFSKVYARYKDRMSGI
ncbi:hypothetical protein [Vibrio harveyi]